MRPPVPPPQTGTQPALVLIVDDGPDVKGLYREYLEFCGFRVMIAPGLEGVLQAQASLPDVIVIDLAMPRIDPYETIRQLKGHPRTAHIPLLALSVSPGDEPALARAAGADVCLSKPCVPSQVARVIQTLLVWQRSRGKW